jgi:hydroxyacylglutathione hydrolase
MKQILTDVWETAVESPFPGLTTHAYLLTRDDGNVLFYNTGNKDEIEAMADRGGVAYQFLSHEDEVGDTLNHIADRFNAQLGVHIKERESVARIREPDILFQQKETRLGNIEIIPTAGHSPGSTCVLVHSPTGKRYLFTGDTLFTNRAGGWSAGFIPGHTTPEDGRVLLGSLNVLKKLEPDVVFGSAFAGASGYQAMRSGEWAEHVDRAASALQTRLKATG